VPSALAGSARGVDYDTGVCTGHENHLDQDPDDHYVERPSRGRLAHIRESLAAHSPYCHTAMQEYAVGSRQTHSVVVVNPCDIPEENKTPEFPA
jgi:hypothetical protein